ncbi:hypothetical protein HJG60_011572 [Phyllostomus discolor]|uniref:Uncharacterized protein n=1 Tax=Phyllostomus discolor TaxID=89673 RepID=A0A833ZZ84_9CHIR|nr:hypothetical protein HJG60_011572 [Phyllostomus discolor]
MNHCVYQPVFTATAQRNKEHTCLVFAYGSGGSASCPGLLPLAPEAPGSTPSSGQLTEAGEAKLDGASALEPLLISHPLTFPWAKQVTWPRPSRVEMCLLPLPVGGTAEPHGKGRGCIIRL